MTKNVIAILNIKKASGKTTTVVNLGASLALAGSNVLLVDGSLEDRFSSMSDLAESGVVLDRQEKMVMRSTSLDGLTVLCRAGILLQHRETAASNMETLRKLVDQFDWVLIDTPSQDCPALRHLMTLAEGALVPVQEDGDSFEGLPATLRILIESRRQHPALRFDGLLQINCSPAKTSQDLRRAHATYECIAKAYSDVPFRHSVPYEDALSSAAQDLTPLARSAPFSAASIAFNNIAGELRQRRAAGSASAPAQPRQPSFSVGNSGDLAATIVDSSITSQYPAENSVSAAAMATATQTSEGRRTGTVVAMLGWLKSLFGSK